MTKIYDVMLEHIDFIMGVGIGLLFALFVGTLLNATEEYKYDLNEDGVVNIKDMLLIQEYILDNEGCECNE